MSTIARAPITTGVTPSSVAQRSPWLFFALMFLLSIPFALLGFVTKLRLIPGIPISALGVVCPATAAVLLSYREGGRAGATALLRRSLEFKRSLANAWLLPILLLMPCIALITY